MASLSTRRVASRVALGFAGAAVLAFAACARAPAGSAPEATAPAELSDVRRTGTVTVLGSAPTEWVALRTEAGAPIRLDGELSGDLRRLAGARVAVQGRAAGDGIEVEAYEVLSVDGRPVISGRVESAPDGGLQLRTPGGQAYQLHDPPAALRPGQEIWIQGPAAIRVQRYGTIR